MPDYFIPLDTTKYTKYHRELAAKSIIIQQNLRYVDQNRKALHKKYDTRDQAMGFKEFKEEFEVPRKLIDDIVAEGKKQNITPKDEAEMEQTLPYLRLQLKALIARDLWDMSEYFSVINEDSEAVKKALELLSE